MKQTVMVSSASRSAAMPAQHLMPGQGLAFVPVISCWFLLHKEYLLLEGSSVQGFFDHPEVQEGGTVCTSR